jgi:hypothetical protein
LKTPIAIFVFNRPETTKRVLAQIATYQPRQLFIVADGPRYEAEVELCRQTRELFEHIEWDCEVLTQFSDVNLGCKNRMASGLSWVFSECEQAIILEDDCLPDSSFFAYCDELLEKYENDRRVMAIGGSMFPSATDAGPYSYYFSRHVSVWGWASWRRAWDLYDREMGFWPCLRETGWLSDLLGVEFAASRWKDFCDDAFQGRIDTWDIQWVYSCWAQNALAISPQHNLVTNIGFGPEATHTLDPSSQFANVPSSPIQIPLLHPPVMVRNVKADLHVFDVLFSPFNLSATRYARIRRLIGRTRACATQRFSAYR